MSRNRFDDILQALRYTTEQASVDKFWDVRDMIRAWNANMTENFTPSWVSCLDESMSMWTQMFSCPGFIYVPRKPWPFENEYHSICCGLSRIMWQIEMVEGKDAPRYVTPEFQDRGGKTVGLLLRLTRSIWYKGMALVLDSGFCVLKGIVELRKVGVFAASVIKKRRYWPKYIRGDDIKVHFEDKEVGDVDCWQGHLDNVPFGIHCIKEPDYTMALMASYGTQEVNNEGETERSYKNQEGISVRKRFSYTELFYNHFKYRHAVDDHNNNRHQPISLEVVWVTQRWANRVFAVLLAITEVNIKLASEYFLNKPKISMISFRKYMADALINNKEYRKTADCGVTRELRTRSVDHKLLTVKPFKRWNGAKWIKADTRFPQRKCVSRHRKVRTYCSCNLNKGMCNSCYTDHFLNVEFAAMAED